ncbi:MAG: hypothetical protein ACHQXA_06980 [Gemmatimonadales bacterium]
MRPISGTLLLFLAGCGGNSTAGGPSPKGRATTPIVLTTPVSYHPLTPARYLFYRRDSVIMILPNGSEVSQVVGRTFLFTLSVTPAVPGTSGPARINVVVDSVSLDPDAPATTRSLYDGLVGTRWTGNLAPTGQVSGFAADRHSSGADLAAVDLARLLPTLPSGGAKSGASWSDTVDAQFPIQNLQVTERFTANASASPAPADTVGLQIETSGILARSGENSQLALGGGGTRSVAFTIGADGRLLSEAGADSVVMKVTVKAVGQSVTLRQLGRFTVTLKP